MKKTTLSFILVLCLFINCLKPAFATDFSESSGVNIKNYTDQTVEDLAVLCKVWGYLKFYHPEVITGKYDMDAELFRVMPKILKSKTTKERNRVLNEWVSGFGEVVSSSSMTYPPDEKVKVYPDLDWIGDESNLGQLSGQLLKMKDAERKQDTTYYARFPYGNSPFFPAEKTYPEMSTFDTGYRLLGLFRLWNAIQYYSAYKYLMEDSWDNRLREYIPQFIDVEGMLGYKLALLKLLTCTEDTHSRIFRPVEGRWWDVPDPDLEDWYGKYMLPFQITFVEDKAVITDSYSNPGAEEYPFRNGDVILSINGEPVENIVERYLEYTPASHFGGKQKKIATTLLRSPENTMTVEYEREEGIFNGTFALCQVSDITIPNRTRKDLPAFTLLDNGIGYIYMGSPRGEKLPDPLDPDLKGVIMDLRAYPHTIPNMFGYAPFLKEQVDYVMRTYVSRSYPGLFHKNPGELVKGGGENYFKGKKIVLIDDYSQSSSEFLAMLYRTNPETILIGSRTTGSDGMISIVPLPGDIEAIFTGMGIYYPDGSETQRIGILPHIEVKQTIKGVREGRDDLIEKAIELILKN